MTAQDKNGRGWRAAIGFLAGLAFLHGSAASALTDAVPMAYNPDPALQSDTAAGSSSLQYLQSPGARQVSDDGRYAVFVSNAPNLIANQSGTPGMQNVFLYDAQTATVQLISHVAGSLATGGSRPSYSPTISADGQRVAFYSCSSDLFVGLTAGGCEIYLYDLANDATRLVSHTPASATAGGNSRSSDPVISADGQWIAFYSCATDLIEGFSDGARCIFNDEIEEESGDVYLYDVANDKLRLVSHAAGSVTKGSDWVSGGAAISADGQRVAFESCSSNLIAGLSVSGCEVYLYDVATAAVWLVSHAAASAMVDGNGGSSQPTISADGQRVVFHSDSTDLVEDFSGSDDSREIYLYDAVDGSIRLVSHIPASATTGGGGNSDLGVSNSVAPNLAISADGTRVVFTSCSSNLITEFSDPDSGSDRCGEVYLYDLADGAVRLISHAAASVTAGGNRESDSPTISADGQRVAFYSCSSNLIAVSSDGDACPEPGRGEVYLYDLTNDALRLVSHAADSATVRGNGLSYGPVISADGRIVIYSSTATTLQSGIADLNYGTDVLRYSAESQGNRYLTLAAENSIRVRLGDSGLQPAAAASRRLLSDDGRYVVFLSRAPNLFVGQAGRLGIQNVFLYDAQTATVRLISHVPGSPTTGANGDSEKPVISADGRWVAFRSCATNLSLASGGNRDCFNGTYQIYLHDVASGVTRLVSHAASSATVRGNLGGDNPVISADGQSLAYFSCSRNLVAGFSNGGGGCGEVYLYDVTNDTTRMVSHVAGSPAVGGDATGFDPVISADGQRVAFTSCSNNLIAGFSNGGGAGSCGEIYLYDVATDAMRLVSHAVGSTTVAGNSYSSSPAISADGQRVAFVSCSSDLIPDFSDQRECGEIYLYSVADDSLRLLSRAAGSVTAGGNRSSSGPVISADGQQVSFSSCSSNLIADFADSGPCGEIYLYDLDEDTLRLISHVPGSMTVAGNSGSRSPVISADGQRVAFISCSSDLTADFSDNGETVTGNCGEIYLYDVADDSLELVSHAAGSAAAGDSNSEGHAISADGAAVVFNSYSSNLSAISVFPADIGAYYYSAPRTSGGSSGGAIGLNSLLLGLLALTLRCSRRIWTSLPAPPVLSLP